MLFLCYNSHFNCPYVPQNKRRRVRMNVNHSREESEWMWELPKKCEITLSLYSSDIFFREMFWGINVTSQASFWFENRRRKQLPTIISYAQEILTLPKKKKRKKVRYQFQFTSSLRWRTDHFLELNSHNILTWSLQLPGSTKTCQFHKVLACQTSFRWFLDAKPRLYVQHTIGTAAASPTLELKDIHILKPQ